MSDGPFDTLLSPLQVGSIELKNRVVSTAHGAFLDFYREGTSPDRYVAYQERRARGGSGLIILQPVHVHPSSHALGHFIPNEDDLRSKFAAMADALHRHGTRVVCQIMHFGGQFTSEARRDLEPLWSFSGFPSPEGEPSHAMSTEEIEQVLDGFARTAAIAVESGLDGVEVHGAHGYLVQQSFSPWANIREDEWGQRFHFLDELLSRVRAATGPDAVVGFRISADDFVRPERGGLGIEGLKEVARHAVSGGLIDYLNHSEGAKSSHYARAVANYRHPRGEFLPLAAGLREAINEAVPVVGVGRIVDPTMAEQALLDGMCDLVGLTRAQIADPAFVSKLQDNRSHHIRPCVGANQGCIDRMEGALPITCFHNPEVGREVQSELVVAERPKRVLVVGAGPAGLKAAEIAARRGHKVSLVDRESEVGGLLRCVGELGSAAELLGSVAWMEQAIEDLDVDVRLGIEVDAALIAVENPDVVVLATGARPNPAAPAECDGSVPILSPADVAWSIWQGHTFDPKDQHVLVVDTLGNLETALAVEALAGRGAAVTVVTPYAQFGPHVGFTHRKDLLDAVYGSGCRVETSSIFTGLQAGRASWRHVHSRSQSEESVDAVVAGVARLPDLSLLDAARSSGARVLLAGDAVAPRTAMHAFREGDNVGRQI
jgi:2,4-dienoyl-CoA reductase-like NADH-dependent reductase (Old Yellow Enzyme family)